MIAPFILHHPQSLREASSLLSQFGTDARVLAGGSELVLLLKLGLTKPSHIIDIKKIPGLVGLDYNTNSKLLRIGPLVTHRDLEKSPMMGDHFPLVVEMEKQLANVRVRNVGTLAGNLSFAEPHADPGTLLVAYDAKVKLANGEGERVVNLQDFFVDYYETVLKSDELLAEIIIHKPADYSRGAYLRFCPSERPMVGIAFLAEWCSGVCTRPRLVLGCVGPKPLRVLEVEDWMEGRSPDEVRASANDLGDRAARQAEPLEDIWGSVEYKKQIVKTLVARAIVTATQRLADHG
jgi:carbon-monoxide dehydrogenase medium subunit